LNLQRFVEAQNPVWPQVESELSAGAKRSHWMWFIFPQLAGLGRSEMARHYAIRSRTEAAAYLGHKLLGPRLLECTGAVLRHRDAPAERIFGEVDAVKFRSSMTLFDAVAGAAEPSFAAALGAFYGGEADERTLALLDRCKVAS
jgi:uncharacterized protein (DUF1810 family)